MSFKISTHNFTLCAAISNHEHKLTGFRKKCMLIEVKGTLQQLFAISTIKWEKRSHLIRAGVKNYLADFLQKSDKGQIFY